MLNTNKASTRGGDGVVNPLERAKLKASLIQLGENWLYEVCVTLQISVSDEARSLDDMGDRVVAEVESGRVSYEAVLRLADYMKHAPNIEHKTLGLTKASLGQLLGVSADDLERTTRQALIAQLRGRVLTGQIQSATITARRDLFMRNRIEQLKKTETRAYIATRLLGSKVEDITARDLTDLVLRKVSAGELDEGEMSHLIKEAQRETALAKKREIQAPSLQKIEQRVDQLARDVRELRVILSRFDEGRSLGLIRDLRPDTGKGVGRFLVGLKLALAKVGDRSENRFEAVLAALQKQGWTLQSIFEQAELVTLLGRVENVVQALKFRLSPEDFYVFLKEETSKLKVPTNLPIHVAREVVSRRLELTDQEFNDYLVECRSKGWVRLIEGAPYSENESNWLDMDGRRYYYLQLTRD